MMIDLNRGRCKLILPKAVYQKYYLAAYICGYVKTTAARPELCPLFDHLVYNSQHSQIKETADKFSTSNTDFTDHLKPFD